jgi:heme/copper-type cytochrome/quinol oxidase subunit 2
MGIGTSIVLIAIGAILRFAVHGHVSGVSIGTVGIILIIAGVLGLVISLFFTSLWAQRTRPRRDPYEPPARY